MPVSRNAASKETTPPVEYYSDLLKRVTREGGASLPLVKALRHSRSSKATNIERGPLDMDGQIAVWRNEGGAARQTDY